MKKDKIAKGDFTERVVQLGGKGMEIIEDYFDGSDQDAEKVKYASKAVSQTLAALNMKRVEQYQDRSLALRLLKYLPSDEGMRRKYIQATNPEIKPALLGMPGK